MRTTKKQPPPSRPDSTGRDLISHPPSPSATSDLALGGEDVVRGNSDLQPMLPQGHARISEIGQDLAKKGGADSIQPGTARRQRETAEDLSAAGAGPVAPPDPGLESHALGALEGAPKSPASRELIRQMVKKFPTERIPGRGKMSSRSGESEVEFEKRVGASVLALMQKLAQDPAARIVVPTSTQVVKFVRGWLSAGLGDNFRADPDEMLKESGGSPGSMERLFPEQDGNWQLQPFSLSGPDFPPGIYFLDHGETSSSTNPSPTSGQRARAEIVKAVLGRDWKTAQRVALAASRSGILSDEDISTAIDEALPDETEAEDLLPHELLSVMSAAGPEKRGKLRPVLDRRFGDLSALNADSQNRLKSHLGRLRA